ncbi:8-oxo-dGTP diphosphatase [Atopomonas hussainii]|uniref:8-oxo-dGTP diphosphatase n=1 Tax=Atopomonas hussainii TaxID=1429083 RepID=A0A1H7Q821_9GAMM|nr:Nudix family hydrolase [Atopomonas hussainii]SEL44240.1 8-oxo-dGTP diphosphatase [Atopomonas hussainii]
MKRIHVMAAVIVGEDGRILLAKRAANQHQGGLWEFPGGKCEAGETREQALDRELHEELGIRVTAARPLIQVSHDYADKSVLLDVWRVTGFSGEPHGAEGQPLAWVVPPALSDYHFPAANLPIVSAAQLPDCYWVTAPEWTAEHALAQLTQALAAGAALIYWRLPQLSAAAYLHCVQQAAALCAGRAQLMLHGEQALLAQVPGAGWHLSAAQLQGFQGERPAGVRVAASCHNAAELALANQLGVDFVTLSPLLQTASHPEAEPLGWAQAEQLLKQCLSPAYLLGGVSPADLPQAWQVGAQGIAAIRGLWHGVGAA